MGSQKSNRKTCDFYAELISAYLDDELSAIELLDIAEHLKICPQCHSLLDSLIAAKKILHQAEPFWIKISPSKEFLPSIITRLKSEFPDKNKAGLSAFEPRISTRISSRLFTLAAASLASLLLFFGTTLYFANYQKTKVATTEEKAVDETEPRHYVAKTEPEEDLEEYIRDHTLGYSNNLLVDYEEPVEFVGYVRP